MVPAGSDKLREIGWPSSTDRIPVSSAPVGDAMSTCLQQWGAAVSDVFSAAAPNKPVKGAQDEAASAARRLMKDQRYSEEEVDAARSRWEEVLVGATAPARGSEAAAAKRETGGNGSTGTTTTTTTSNTRSSAAARVAMSRLKQPTRSAAAAAER